MDEFLKEKNNIEKKDIMIRTDHITLFDTTNKYTCL